jgi:hypothetical protein
MGLHGRLQGQIYLTYFTLHQILLTLINRRGLDVRICNTQGTDEGCIQILAEKSEEREIYDDVGIDGRIILILILKD